MSLGSFNNIAIIGLGFMGIALAKSLKTLKNNFVINGYDINEDLSSFLLNSGIIDNNFIELNSLVKKSDVIFLTTPIIAFKDILLNIKDDLNNQILVDFGSVKNNVYNTISNILEVNNLTYSYNNNKTIFNNLQFSIKKETINLLLGSNSSGKTTLIRLLSGILPTNENVSIDEIKLNKQNIRKYMLSIGVVFFDDPNKFLFDNVLDELAFPLENLNYKKDIIINRIYEVRNILDLQNCLNKKISNLTYYEQVKVLIGTSIIHKPKIIFLDNPFSKLNDLEIKKVFKFLDKIKKDTTVFITSSNLDQILLFDDVIVIDNGNVLIHDNPKNVLQHDNELSKAGFIIPPMIDLSLKLSFYGIIDEVITDVNEMVNKLWK